jgi:hypothetical protein
MSSQNSLSKILLFKEQSWDPAQPKGWGSWQSEDGVGLESHDKGKEGKFQNMKVFDVPTPEELIQKP